MASRKMQFAQKVMGFCVILAQVADDGYDARETFQDRGWHSGGDNPIQDSDIAGLEITATELQNALTLFDELYKLLNNQATTTKDYDKDLNKVRDDL